MLAPELITAPASAPVTLVEAKLALRVDHGDDDTLITGLIAAAVSYLDGSRGILGQALVTQTWKQPYACFASRLRLPFGPAASIVSVKYFDGDNVEQTLDASVYCLLSDERGPYVRLQYGQSWPGHIRRDDAVAITFIAGRAADKIEGAIHTALLMLIAHFYEHRGAVDETQKNEMPVAVDMLLRPFRKISL